MDNVIWLPDRRRNRYAELRDQVLEKNLQPEDEYEIVALLEALGWTDKRARDEFGTEDVFQLAREIQQLDARKIEVMVNDYKEEEPRWPVIKQSIGQFLRGMVFALPMLLSVVAMLTLHFSLWSYVNLSTRTATSIAIGTILSFATVGGYMQAMARQGYFYMYQGYYQMMQKMTFRLILLGVISSLLIAFVGIALDIVFPELPFGMVLVALLFYLVLTVIWLAVAVLYVLRREVWFTSLLAVGIGLVYVLFRLFHLDILLAQLLSMSAVAISAMVILRYFFKRADQAADKGVNPPLPKFSVTVYNVAPYFLYGTLYFCLLFTDRLMAWSAYTPGVPFVVWFRGDYELGLDFALPVLTIPMGISEVIVFRLMSALWSSQKDYSAIDYKRMNTTFLKQYRRRFAKMGVIVIGNGVLLYGIVEWLSHQAFFLSQARLKVDATTQEVFIVALVAYSILAMGLLNSVIMFSLSRPALVVRPMLMALGIDFATGFLFTRWLSYPQAVWALLIACVFFTFATWRNVQSVLRTLDYHMYLLS